MTVRHFMIESEGPVEIIKVCHERWVILEAVVMKNTVRNISGCLEEGVSEAGDFRDALWNELFTKWYDFSSVLGVTAIFPIV